MHFPQIVLQRTTNKIEKGYCLACDKENLYNKNTHSKTYTHIAIPRNTSVYTLNQNAFTIF